LEAYPEVFFASLGLGFLMPVGITFPRLWLLVGPDFGEHLEEGVLGLDEFQLRLDIVGRRHARLWGRVGFGLY
jgi:hypothetical protein